MKDFWKVFTNAGLKEANEVVKSDKFVVNKSFWFYCYKLTSLHFWVD